MNTSYVNMAHPHARRIVALWPLSDGGGRAVRSLVGPWTGTYNGTYSGVWGGSDSGQFGLVSQGASNSNIYYNGTTTVNMGITSKFTAMVYVYQGYAIGVKYLTKLNGASPYNGLELSISSYDLMLHPGGVYAGNRLSVNVQSLMFIGTTGIPNRWHHIAGTFDGVKCALYLDGRKIGENTPSSPNPNNNVTQARSDLLNSSYAKCVYGDLRLYSDALSPSEIMSIAQDRMGIYRRPNIPLSGLISSGVSVPVLYHHRQTQAMAA